jgi:hypothetical protein
MLGGSSLMPLILALHVRVEQGTVAIIHHRGEVLELQIHRKARRNPTEMQRA